MWVSTWLTLANVPTNPAEFGGYVCGAIFTALIPLLLIRKCVRALRRPTTLKSGVMSVLLFLVLLLGVMVISFFPKVRQDRFVMVLISLSSFVVMLAGLVLGIVSMVVFSQKREVKTAGRAYGVWGLLLNGMGVSAMLITFLHGVYRVHAAAPQELPGGQGPGEYVRIDEFNFRFQLPDAPWRRVTPERLNKAACFALMRDAPEEYLIIIPQKLEAGHTVDCATTVEELRSDLELKREGIRLGPVQPETVGNLSGLRFDSQAQSNSTDIAYSYLIAVDGDFAWTIIVFGGADRAAEISRDARELCRSFGVIERGRRGPQSDTPGGEPENIAFDRFNFRYRFPDRPWVRLDAPKVNPDATFAMRRLNPNVMFFIIAERLSGAPDLSVESLVELCRSNLKLKATEVQFALENPEPVNGLPGVRLNAWARVNGTPLFFSYWVATRGPYTWQLITSGSADLAGSIPDLARDLAQQFEILNPVADSTTQPAEPAAPDPTIG